LKLDEPMTFPEAAREIGWNVTERNRRAKGRALKRLIVKRESEIGRTIAIRDSRGQPHRVTVGAIHRYLPECRPSRVEALAASIRPYVAAMDSRMSEVVQLEIAREVEPKLEALDGRVSVLEEWTQITERYFEDLRKLNARAAVAGAPRRAGGAHG
jgi:hypothetical protein